VHLAWGGGGGGGGRPLGVNVRRKMESLQKLARLPDKLA